MPVLPVQLKVKLVHELAQLPTYAKSGDSGADLRCVLVDGDGKPGSYSLKSGETAVIRTGLAFEIPEGYELQVRGRSGLSSDGLHVHLGTVDQGFRGEVCIIVTNLNQAQSAGLFGMGLEGVFPAASGKPITITHGDRLAQLVLAPVTRAAFAVADELGETERGSAGLGSTGNV